MEGNGKWRRRSHEGEGSSVEVEVVGEEESMGVEVAEGNGWGCM
jgi:hypothetical protein